MCIANLCRISRGGLAAHSTTMRNSNIEKLRIVCIFMIITMHVFGQYQNVSDPIFRHTCIFVNAFCNSAVTITNVECIIIPYAYSNHPLCL